MKLPGPPSPAPKQRPAPRAKLARRTVEPPSPPSELKRRLWTINLGPWTLDLGTFPPP